MKPAHAISPAAPVFDWDALLSKAAAIVESYDTLVTLRQLFYRLVAASAAAEHGECIQGAQ